MCPALALEKTQGGSMASAIAHPEEELILDEAGGGGGAVSKSEIKMNYGK